ncbi:MAG: hypothetical protein E7358_07070 [Clostridiales bacterium]|nr:hypothetical protein [Clostridiales bacterium]
MSIKKTIEVLENELSEFNPVVLDYGKDKVVGFANESGSSDLVIFVKADEMVMSFGFQNAHFASDDVKSCVEHTKKYLRSEYASVEFFKEEKDLFGGSRPVEVVKFDTVENIINCYSMGNEQATEGLYKFFRENGEITVRAITYDNKLNLVSKVKYDGDKFVVTVIR